MNKIIVELSEFEATQFVEFQKYYGFFKFLKDSGFFELKNGKFEIHKDKYGDIRIVDKVEHLLFTQ